MKGTTAMASRRMMKGRIVQALTTGTRRSEASTGRGNRSAPIGQRIQRDIGPAPSRRQIKKHSITTRLAAHAASRAARLVRRGAPEEPSPRALHGETGAGPVQRGVNFILQST